MRHERNVSLEREHDIVEEIESWEKRTACQISPHMRMAIDLYTIIKRARQANARMFAQLNDVEEAAFQQILGSQP